LKALRSGYPGPAALPSGMYPLASHPDCEQPYWGTYHNANLYVVDQLGEHEKIFRRSQRREASAYSRQHDVTIKPYLARNLCQDAMVEFFGE
jgi:hypothetical protein